MIIVLGHVVAREGCLDELLALSRQHVERSRREPGCLSHDVHRDGENPSRLVFVEKWADLEALRVHFAVPASGAFVRAAAALAAGPPGIEIFEARATSV